jgi:hypothetical protein
MSDDYRRLWCGWKFNNFVSSGQCSEWQKLFVVWWFVSQCVCVCVMDLKTRVFHRWWKNIFKVLSWKFIFFKKIIKFQKPNSASKFNFSILNFYSWQAISSLERMKLFSVCLSLSHSHHHPTSKICTVRPEEKRTKKN